MVRDRVLKVGIRVGFGAGLLENACWTLLWPVFGPCMTGFEICFDSGAVSRTGKIDKSGKKIYIPVLGVAHSHG